MFRISAENAPDGFVLKLEGRLSDAWVEEADACWRAAVAAREGRSIVADLRDISAIDDAGRELLTRMHQAGTRLVVRGCVMREILREIAEAQDGWAEESRVYAARKEHTRGRT